MLKTPYTKNDRTYANDLKIFIGKRMEIAELESKDQLVNRKWYLAWDTGEFFIANSMRKLVRYGGSAKTLSENDIKDIIKEYTKSDLDIIRAQLVSILNQYKDINLKMIDFQKEFDNTITHLETKTIEYILSKVDEVMENVSLYTYSKSEIDKKIDTCEINAIKYGDQKYAPLSSLTNYASKANLNDAIKNKLAYASGDNIALYVSEKKSGVFLSTSTTENKNIEKGHTYLLNNGNIEDITIVGSIGGGTITTKPTISLVINGASTRIVEAFQSIDTDLTFSYFIQNYKNLDGKLLFKEKVLNREEILRQDNIEPKPEGNIIYNPKLIRMPIGNYVYTLVGTDKDRNIIKGTYTISSIPPIFYGSSFASMPNNNSIINANKKIQNNINGEYVIRSSDSEYLWIAVYYNKKITKITMNGFNVPITEQKFIDVDFGNSNTLKYNFYRTVETIQAGTWNITVE